MSTESIAGRVAVITGASSGIGEATARALVADGNRVALLARRADLIGALASELGNAALAIGADVTDRDSLVEAAERDGGGDIVNVSSVAGRTARPGNAVYAATKWGINDFSEGLRQELQPDIRVTVIEPGAVATELTEHITDDATKQATQEFVRDLAITAQDIADVIAFAVSRPRRMTLNEILVRPTAQTG